MDIDPERYEPRYVRVSAVPIEVQDTYDDAEKRTALFNAETDLELDRRGGERIEEDEVVAGHIHAVLNLATYYLVRGASSPSDVTLGDLEDGGDEQQSHAQQYYDTYTQIVESLAQSADGQPGTYFGETGNPGGVVSVNVGEDARRHDLHKPIYGSGLGSVAKERFMPDSATNN